MAGTLEASAAGCFLSVSDIDTQLRVKGNWAALLAALLNLLSNTFKFTHVG